MVAFKVNLTGPWVCLDIQSNVILGGFVRVLLDKFSISINGLSKTAFLM